jgi:hypothetical protein
MEGPETANMTKDDSLILEFQQGPHEAPQSGQRASLPPNDFSQRRILIGNRSFSRKLGWAFAVAVMVVLLVGVGISNLMISRNSSHVASRALSYMDFGSSRNPAPSPSGIGKLYSTESESVSAQAGEEASAERPGLEAPQISGPMIIGTASLNITAANFDEPSKAIEQLAAARGGYVEKLDSKAPSGASREIEATLRVPAKQMDALLADLRNLGRVEEESRSNTEVTAQYVDLEARLRSGRAAEQRLLQLLATRTGKLSDVLEAERELARVRGEIESMHGQRNTLLHQVQYSSVQVRLGEEYRETLHTRPVRTGTKIWNALIEGVSNLEAGAVGLLLFIFAYGPSILFWAAIFVIPAWLVWRRIRSRRAEAPASATK